VVHATVPGPRPRTVSSACGRFATDSVATCVAPDASGYKACLRRACVSRMM
jgi:hypothetical protein